LPHAVIEIPRIAIWPSCLKNALRRQLGIVFIWQISRTCTAVRKDDLASHERKSATCR